MKEKCIEKLKEWYSGYDFDYITMKSTEDGCIFATISNDSNRRTISLYRVFKSGNGLEISEDCRQPINGDECFLLFSISQLLRTYARISA